jgi:choline dehydrogenase-like flavoprotein
VTGATPDVIVVGSGPAGISCCWPLVGAGLRVLLVDPGQMQEPVPPDRPSLAEVRGGNPLKQRYLLGEDLRAFRPSVHPSPKIRLSMPAGAVADYRAALGITTSNFDLAGTLATGGLSNVWGSVATAFDAADLAGMPVDAAELLASYRAIAARIGISGTLEDDMGAFHGDVLLQPPLDVCGNARLLLERYAGQGGGDGGFRLGLSRNAVLSQPRPGRDACTLDAFCMWGCARKAIYNAAYELAALQASPNFAYAPGCVVDEIAKSGSGYRLSGRDPATGARVSHAGRRVVLAAGAVSSTRLVLPLLGRCGERRRLLNNPGYIFVLLLPGRLGAAGESRAFGMAELSYALPLDGAGEYTTGLLYNGMGVSPADVAEKMPLSLRGGLALHRMLAPAMVLGLGYLDGRHSANSIRIEQDGDGPRIVIEGGWAPSFPQQIKEARRALGKAFSRLGAHMIPGSFQRLPPGGESHYAGTLSMGDLLTPDCEVVGAEGLYVVDGSAFGRLPAKHFTFGIMANADRVARRIAARYGAVAAAGIGGERSAGIAESRGA